MKLFAGVFGLCFVAYWAISICIGGWLWPYSIEYWSTLCHHPIHIPFIVGIILGVVPPISQLTIPVAIVTWIIQIF